MPSSIHVAALFALSFTACFANPKPSADACFDGRFCSTGEAPKYILCGRGQDCSKAKDEGLVFQSDCRVSMWLGDAQMSRPYEVHGNQVTILPGIGSPEESKRTYSRSKDGRSLTDNQNPKHIHAQSACTP